MREIYEPGEVTGSGKREHLLARLLFGLSLIGWMYIGGYAVSLVVSLWLYVFNGAFMSEDQAWAFVGGGIVVAIAVGVGALGALDASTSYSRTADQKRRTR